MTTTLTPPTTDIIAARPLDLSELAAVARGLATTAHAWPDVVDPAERTWHSIARTDRFEAFVIAWPAGSSIELHDHGAAKGVIAVTAGELIETAVLSINGESSLHSRRLTAGIQLAFGRGHVHAIHNQSSAPALSVHVYSPVLESMTFFELQPGDGPRAIRTEHLEPEAAAR